MQNLHGKIKIAKNCVTVLKTLLSWQRTKHWATGKMSLLGAFFANNKEGTNNECSLLRGLFAAVGIITALQLIALLGHYFMISYHLCRHNQSWSLIFSKHISLRNYWHSLPKYFRSSELVCVISSGCSQARSKIKEGGRKEFCDTPLICKKKKRERRESTGD